MERKQTPQERYDAKNTERIQLKLVKTTDADILARLAAQPKETGGKQGYIKRLIRADIEREKENGGKLLFACPVCGANRWFE